MRAGAIETDRTVRIDVAPSVVWSALERVDEYRSWWPWLRRFEADRLVAGERWRCRIRPPLPWTLTFSVHLRTVERPRLVEAAIGGDIEGWARVEVAPAGDGADIRLRSSLTARRGLSRVLHRAAPALSRRAHDRVIDRGLADFRDRVR